MRGHVPRGAVALLAVGLMVLAGLPSTPAVDRNRFEPLPGTSPGPPPPATSPVRPAIAGAPGWINLTGGGGGSPPALSSAAFAYDVADSAWVLFGGCGAVCPSNETWSFSNGGWRNLTNASPQPPAVRGASMVYDAHAGGLLLFGGADPAAFVNTTWLYRDGRWTNLSYLGGAPLPRAGASMVFDPSPAVNGTVLFGGCIAVLVAILCYNDSWIWRPGAGWAPLDAGGTAPSPRGYSAAAYDPSAGALVLFGGLGICGSSYCGTNDTWEFYGGGWWTIHTPGPVPTARLEGGAAYDAPLAGVVLFGGANLTTGLDTNDSWRFADGGWTELSPASGPLPRSNFGLAADASGGAPLLVGGIEDATGNVVSVTWVFGTAPDVALPGLPSTAEVGAPTSWTVAIGGGTPPFAVTLGYGDGAGDDASGEGPTFVFAHAPTLPGSLRVVATAVDEVGLAATFRTTLVVADGPTVSISPGDPSTDVGFPIAFRASPNGSGPWGAYDWSFGDGSPNDSAGASNVSHSFASTGTFPVTVGVADGHGSLATATLPCVVVALPRATLVTGIGTAGVPLALGANLSGGTGPFRFAWSLGDGGRSSVPSPSHVYARAGTYAVDLWVNDSVGGSAHARSSVTIQNAVAPSLGGPGGAGIPAWYWAFLGGVVAATVVGMVLLVRRRRP